MRSHSWSALRALALAGALACGLTSLFSACKALNSDERDAVSLEGSWLSWRGPWQNGTSRETDLLETLVLDGENHLWSLPLAGRGTPVVAEGRVFALGYEGEGADLQELLVRTREALQELSDEAASRGHRLVVAVVPDLAWVEDSRKIFSLVGYSPGQVDLDAPMNAVNELLDSLGPRVRTSKALPYQPQTNARLEHWHLSLKEGARAALLQSGIATRWWPWACRMWTHI